jgi:hypothetical protein
MLVTVAVNPPPRVKVMVLPVPTRSIFRFVNVETPDTGDLTVAPLSVPDAPPERVAVIATPSSVLTFPSESRASITACVANATNETAEVDGEFVMTIALPAAAIIVNEEESMVGRAPRVKRSFLLVPIKLMFNPEYVTTPEDADTDAVPDKVPDPTTCDTITTVESPVRVFPLASLIVTTGCCENATPAVDEDDGPVVNTSLEAAATVIVTELLAIDVRLPDVNVMILSVPTVLILSPEKVAIPETAFVTVVPLNVPPEAPESVAVIDRVSADRVVPYASWIVTTGCCANDTAETVDGDGAVVSESLVAAPAVIENELEERVVTPLAENCRECDPTVPVNTRLVNDAIPPDAAFVDVPESVAVPDCRIAVTVRVEVLATFPTASLSRTVGCGLSGAPFSALPGCCVISNCDGVPWVMVIAEESTILSPRVNRRVLDPTKLIFNPSPEKLAMPFDPAFVSVPASVPSPLTLDTTTFVVSPVAIFPAASRYSMTG